MTRREELENNPALQEELRRMSSVVTRDIPSDCVAVGNPCKVIRRVNGKS